MRLAADYHRRSGQLSGCSRLCARSLKTRQLLSANTSGAVRSTATNSENQRPGTEKPGCTSPPRIHLRASHWIHLPAYTLANGSKHNATRKSEKTCEFRWFCGRLRLMAQSQCPRNGSTVLFFRMARILVVDDDRDIAELIVHYLKNAGHEPHRLATGTEVMPYLRAQTADLVVLDLMLPGLSGMAVCEMLRAKPSTSQIPVIILTARGDEADRLAGFDRGADDYVTKPFSAKELVARVTALLRRSTPAAAPESGTVRYDGITIDADRHRVTLNGEEVRLTAKEFLLLQYLIRHRGRVLSRDVLLTDVWGYQYTGGTRTVDVHIRRLREKLPLLNDAIETVKQFGYRLV
jgi:DNA-binding response OmpR family regulator